MKKQFRFWFPCRTLVTVIICFMIGLPAMCNAVDDELQKLDSVAEAFRDQSRVCAERGEFGLAAYLLKKAIAAEQEDENDALYIASLHNDLGECYRRMSLEPAQIAIFNERMRILNSSSDDKSGDILLAAKRHLELSLRIKEAKANQKTGLLYIATGLENLAKIYSQMQCPIEAESLYRKAIKIRISKEGAESEKVSSDYLSMGDVIANDGKFLHVAENAYKMALRIYSLNSPMQPVVGVCHQRIASLVFLQDRMATAGFHYDEAIKVFTKHLPSTKENLRKLKESDLPTLPMQAYGQAYAQIKDSNGTGEKKMRINQWKVFRAASLRLDIKSDVKFANDQLIALGVAP